MKYAKMLGLLAVAAAALMAFVGTASATELTSPKGTKLLNGAVIKATAGTTTLDGTINISCAHSKVEGSITDTGSSTTTVKGNVTTLTFENCGNHTVEVKQKGTLEIHKTTAGTGTLTSSGATVTVLTHSLFLGTRHCLYVTNNTDVGTFTESNHNGGSHTTATIHIDSLPIPQEAGSDPLCGDDAEWTGTYEVTSPDHLYID